MAETRRLNGLETVKNYDQEKGDFLSLFDMPVIENLCSKEMHSKRTLYDTFGTFHVKTNLHNRNYGVSLGYKQD